MLGRRRGIRMVATAVAAGALLAATTMPAAAWPIELTAEDTTFLNVARGNFPGDDDTLLLVGRQMCRSLYAGQSAVDVTNTIAQQYGATPDQASIVLGAARSTYCTQAPG